MFFVRQVNHSNFQDFIKAQRAAIVMLGPFEPSAFPQHLADFLSSKYPNQIDLGCLNVTKDFLLSHWFSEHVQLDNSSLYPNGYYLFIDGVFVGFHPTFYEMSNPSRINTSFVNATLEAVLEAFDPLLMSTIERK